MEYVDTAADGGPTDGLLAWLGRQLSTTAVLTMRTGFFSAPAMALLQGPLQRLLADGGRLLAVVGGDVLQSDGKALQSLYELCRLFPGTATAYVVTAPTFQNAKTYHLQHQDGRQSAWVGSANVTMGGFATNWEAAITLESTDDDPATVQQVRAATVATIRQPTVELLDQQLLERLQNRPGPARWWPPVRESLEPPAPLLISHGPATIDNLERLAAGGADPDVLSTGLVDLDEALDGGLRPGSLTVIAARPGAGTSTLLLHMLCQAAIERATPSCLYTCSTRADEIALRVLSNTTRVPLRSLRTARLTDRQWLALAEAMHRYQDAPLYIDAGAPPPLDVLCAAIVAATSRHQLKLVAVDEPGALLHNAYDGRDRSWIGHGNLAEVVERLKALAMHLAIPLITTAQLGRVRDDPDWSPSTTELRELAAVACAADVHIVLHRLDHSERDHPRGDEVDLIVTKNRQGRTSTVTVAHRLYVARFENLRNQK